MTHVLSSSCPVSAHAEVSILPPSSSNIPVLSFPNTQFAPHSQKAVPTLVRINSTGDVFRVPRGWVDPIYNAEYPPHTLMRHVSPESPVVELLYCTGHYEEGHRLYVVNLHPGRHTPDGQPLRPSLATLRETLQWTPTNTLTRTIVDFPPFHPRHTPWAFPLHACVEHIPTGTLGYVCGADFDRDTRVLQCALLEVYPDGTLPARVQPMTHLDEYRLYPGPLPPPATPISYPPTHPRFKGPYHQRWATCILRGTAFQGRQTVFVERDDHAYMVVRAGEKQTYPDGHAVAAILVGSRASDVPAMDLLPADGPPAPSIAPFPATMATMPHDFSLWIHLDSEVFPVRLIHALHTPSEGWRYVIRRHAYSVYACHNDRFPQGTEETLPPNAKFKFVPAPRQRRPCSCMPRKIFAQEKTCCICTRPYINLPEHNRSRQVLHPCGHTFCMECAATIAKTSNCVTCALCKTPVCCSSPMPSILGKRRRTE